MTYIFNKYLNPNKRVRTELASIYGLGFKLSNQLCDQLGLNQSCRISQLTKNQIDKLNQLINKQYFVELELKKLISKDVQRFVQIGSYKGFRHIAGLPLRGQRTHTNAKNSRKNRITFR